MSGKKCSLCGGNLDKNYICTECGLDNRKSDKSYKINRSSSNRQYSFGGRKKRRTKGMVILFAVLLLILGVNVLRDVFWDIVYRIETGISGDTYQSEPRDPYEDVEKELCEEGETAEYVLEPGEYIVGVHIPEGKYTAEVQDDFDTVHVSDYQNIIYLYEYAGKEEENYLDDLRLYDGACVTIDTEDNNTVTLSTENAQIADMHGADNPLTEPVHISSRRTWKAGEDFEAGVYDLEVVKGTGGVTLIVYDREGDSCESRFMYLSADGKSGYRNLVIPENAQISFEEGDAIELTLTPSEVISSVNYLGYYIYYLEEEDE